MASSAALKIEVTADTSSAIGDLDKAAGAMKSYGNAADTASKQTRDVAGGIETVGGVAGGATTGLRDMSDAVALAGFPELAAGMGIAATGLESLDGAATLYKAAQEGLSKAVVFFDGVLKSLKVTILTNPIFIIAAIVIAIAIAFVLLYQHCETFRKIVDKAFAVALDVIQTLWNWIKASWPLIEGMLTAPFRLGIKAIGLIWDTLTTGVTDAKDLIGKIWDKIEGILKAPFTDAWTVISGVFGKINEAIQKVLDLIAKIKIPHVDLNPFNKAAPSAFGAPAVAGFARAPAAARAGTSGGGGPTIVINGALDPEAVARQVRQILRGHEIRVGRPAVAL